MSYDPLKNWDESRPFITAIVRTFPGDWHLLPRALASIDAQELDRKHFEVFVVHDGPVSEEQLAQAKAMGEGEKFILMWTDVQYGYYCMPSNMATLHARGHYIAYLDADNEWAPQHLRMLLEAIRYPSGEDGFPHFTYSRVMYVTDPGYEAKPDTPLGEGHIQHWSKKAAESLMTGPMRNFVDSSQFLVAKSALFQLANLTGAIWNPECRRFGDWELVARMAAYGFRGHAVDTVSLIYHWTGKNLQLTRMPDGGDLIAVPQDLYEQYRQRGMLREVGKDVNKA